MTEPARRVRVMHPRTEAASVAPVHPAGRRAGATEVDDVSVRSLIRGQARIEIGRAHV